MDTSGPPETCRACGHRSNEPSPFNYAVVGDSWPWLRYGHVFGEHGGQISKKASGCYCAVCWNVFYIARLGDSLKRFICICNLAGNEGMLDSFLATTRYHIWLIGTKQRHYEDLRRRVHRSPSDKLRRFFYKLEFERVNNVPVRLGLAADAALHFVSKEDWVEENDGKWDCSKVSMVFIDGKYVKGIFVQRCLTVRREREYCEMMG